MSRIRYTDPNHQGHQFSQKTFTHPTNGSRYRVKLDIANLSFEILDEVCNQVAAEGKGASAHKVKIAAKDALVSLGISAGEKESRNRNKNKEQVI